MIKTKSNDIEIIKLQVMNNYQIILMNIEGISHEESMIFPHGVVNCMNWILGHLIYVRNGFLKMLGEEPVWEEKQFSSYKRGATPLNRKDELISFQALAFYLEESQHKLEEKINDLEKIHPENISDIGTLCLHEIYHSGQLGYLRRILGKPGAIP